MKLVIYQSGKPPQVMTCERLRVEVKDDHFEMREQDGLLIRVEEHKGTIAMGLTVHPGAANVVRLKGGK